MHRWRILINPIATVFSVHAVRRRRRLYISRMISCVFYPAWCMCNAQCPSRSYLDIAGTIPNSVGIQLGLSRTSSLIGSVPDFNQIFTRRHRDRWRWWVKFRLALPNNQFWSDKISIEISLADVTDRNAGEWKFIRFWTGFDRTPSPAWPLLNSGRNPTQFWPPT